MSLKLKQYVEVETVDSMLLDACLLAISSANGLKDYVNASKALKQKAKINKIVLLSKNPKKSSLIPRMAPHVKGLNNLFSYFCKVYDQLDEATRRRIDSKHERGDAVPYYLHEPEQWQECNLPLLDDEPESIFYLINYFRFEEAPKFHGLIPTYIAKYAGTIREVTGIAVAGEEVPYDGEVEPERLRPKGEKEIKNVQTSPYSEEDTSLENVLNEAIEKLEYAKTKMSSIEQELMQKYDAKFKTEIAELMQENKRLSKELEKEAKKAGAQLKTTEKLEKQLEMQKVAAGRLGETIGTLRKDNEELAAQNQAMEKRVKLVDSQQAAWTKQREELEVLLKRERTKREGLEKQLVELKTELNEALKHNAELSAAVAAASAAVAIQAEPEQESEMTKMNTEDDIFGQLLSELGMGS